VLAGGLAKKCDQLCEVRFFRKVALHALAAFFTHAVGEVRIVNQAANAFGNFLGPR
jgi:hypothetical protein